MNKKSIIGYEYIILLFFFLLAFLFTILIIDIVKIEFFTPMHDTVINLTANISTNTSTYYLKSQEIWNDVSGITLPYNLILIFLTAYLITVSIWDSAREEKKSIYSLLFGTLGGTIFLIYFIHLFMINIMEYFEVEILNYLFADLIATYVPFYEYIMSIWGIFILIWVLTLAFVNNFFGVEN